MSARAVPVAFGLSVACTLLSTTAAVEAQQTAKLYRIGVVAFEGADDLGGEAFREALRGLGYVDGRNIRIEWRTADGQADRFPGLVADLLRKKVDVLVASGNPAIVAARKATRTIPIVMVFATAPVTFGFVASYAAPGGNTTGTTATPADLTRRRLQLLKEAVPGADRVALLWDPPEFKRAWTVDIEIATREAGLGFRSVEVRTPSELDAALATITRERADAVLVGGSTMMFAQRDRIAEALTKRRLPTFCMSPRYVEAGCLMSYRVDWVDSHRRAAHFVDKILRGARPGELPVEEATGFEIVVNKKTAKAIGLTLPAALVARANRVIDDTMHRIGVLTPAGCGPGPGGGAIIKALGAAGYRMGQNLAIECRGAGGDATKLPKLAAELAERRVAVILASGAAAAKAVRDTTPTLPGVFIAADALLEGVVPNLARPGGNLTGYSFLGRELAEKQTGLLREVVPGLRRVAVLGDPTLDMNLSLHLAQELRAATGVEYRFLSVSGADDFEKVFQDARRWGAGAVLIGPTGDNYVYRSRIASLALQMGLATMTFVAIVEDGGLMSYGPDEAEFARIIAKHIDRILRGARPGELPVEQPSTFQLVVNLKTAKALGVKFPPSVLLRADRVIE